LEKDLDQLRVVLVSTRNPLNIGAAARAMSNFGIQHLRVVNPYEASFREARSAVGAAELLANAEECSSVAEAVADCTLVVGTTAGRDRELHQPWRSLEQAGEAIQKELTRGRVAILFGSEKRGLSNEDLVQCHWLMRIPTREEHPSMNLGQAVAVCLYELMRTKPKPSTKAMKERATSAEIDRLCEALLESLHTSGYIKPNSAKATEDKVHRLVRRLDLRPDDAELLVGMIRKMLWKMKSTE
jgi:TrmH family RNA methyltransferase